MSVLIALIALSAPQFWTCYDEVLQLSEMDGVLCAHTSGGNLIRGANGWEPSRLEIPPSPERELPNPPPNAGAFCSATVQYLGKTLYSFWGGKQLFAESE